MSRIVPIFDLILFWPLEIGEKDAKGRVQRDAIKERLTATSRWSELVDPLRRDCKPEEDGFAYAEWCEFHPFVRRFLYGNPPGGDGDLARPFDLYRNTWATGKILRIEEEDCGISFEIRDLRLYVADNGLAFIILDLTSIAATTWRFALNALSKFRTSYPQFYGAIEKEGRLEGWFPGGAYQKVRIEPDEAKTELKDLHPSAEGRGEELRAALKARRPPILGHWKRLLGPLLEEGVRPHTLSDHRMSAMVWMGVEEAHTLAEADWMALAEADEYGFAPYSDAFVAETMREAAYDRWWDRELAKEQKKDHRYVVGEKVLASVKGLPSGSVPGYVERIRGSWRRQYAQAYFLAQFQRAALLILQDRVAEATPELERNGAEVVCRDERKLLEKIEELQAAMAVFSSRYWFPEVSNQVQPQELYSRVKKKLRLEELYRGVVDDKALLGAWVTAREERRRDKFWNRVNWFFIPMSLVLSFLGANLILDPAKVFVQTTQSGEFLLWLERMFTHDMWVDLATALILIAILGVCWGAFWLAERGLRGILGRRRT